MSKINEQINLEAEYELHSQSEEIKQLKQENERLREINNLLKIKIDGYKNIIVQKPFKYLGLKNDQSIEIPEIESLFEILEENSRLREQNEKLVKILKENNINEY